MTVESQVWRHYQSTAPGMVQVLGVDIWNGSANQMNQFRNITSATFPLLLNGASATGGNVELLYGTYDNHIVLDMRDMTVVYHAALLWPHTDRFHLNEIRNAVDGILATVDAPAPSLPALTLRLAPNPVRDRLAADFVNPLASPARARLAVYDAAGRARQVLFDGTVAPGAGRWEGSLAASGGAMQPGVYFLRLDLAGEARVRRFVVLP